MDSRGGRGTAFCCGLPHTTWASGRSSGEAAAVKDTGQHVRRQLKVMSVPTMMFSGVALLLLSLSIVSARGKFAFCSVRSPELPVIAVDLHGSPT